MRAKAFEAHLVLAGHLCRNSVNVSKNLFSWNLAVVIVDNLGSSDGQIHTFFKFKYNSYGAQISWKRESTAGVLGSGAGAWRWSKLLNTVDEACVPIGFVSLQYVFVKKIFKDNYGRIGLWTSINVSQYCVKNMCSLLCHLDDESMMSVHRQIMTCHAMDSVIKQQIFDSRFCLSIDVIQAQT